MTKRKVRRRLKRPSLKKLKSRFKFRYKLTKQGIIALISLIALIVLITCVITIPRSNQTKALKSLGYDEETIKIIREKKLTKTILNNNYYSKYLEQCLDDGTLREDYIKLYAAIQEGSYLDERDFLIYHRLIDKGYNEDQVVSIFKNLKSFEITPLLVFDVQSDLSAYFEDCKNNRETNSQDNFVLDGTYYTPYENTIAVYDPSSLTKLVNKTYYLSSDFVPNDPETLSVVYAASGVQLSSDAYQAFTDWCDAGIDLGIRFYAASAYRPYEYQEELYNNYVASMGQEQADALSARPGFSEHQTGLTVDLASANTDGISEYKDTVEYQWTSKNCQDYGWILRYPEGKQSITGYEFESWHYRYVGIDTATRVVESGLTYDEFYCLYLKPWEKAENVYYYDGAASDVLTSDTTEEAAQ